MLKYGLDDARDVLERASARETAARVAAGTLAKLLLRQIGIDVLSHIVQLGPERAEPGALPTVEELLPHRRVPGPLRRPRRRGPDGGRREGGGQGRRLARRGGRGHRLRGAGRPRQPRALGPQARRPAGPGPHEHPGHQGGGVRRRLRAGRPAGVGGPRRHPDGHRRRGRRRPGTSTDSWAGATSATPTTPGASRGASPPARPSWPGPP